MATLRPTGFLAALLLLVGLSVPPEVRAYSVLAHESNIDTAWDMAIVPVLKQRFPSVSPAGLLEARAYAYGGCVIQDLGYYPFGSHIFSDLLHYVRSGDFVTTLVRDARDVNELAFALGALAHYAADVNGHPIAVNRSVPIVYPKLREKFGSRVTYADSPSRHVMMEFAFDVAQAAAGTYAPDSYHRFIGFKVAKEALERAIPAVYGLEMDDVLPNADLAISTYRHSVSSIIPEMTKIAWRDKKDEILKASPQLQQSAFVFNYSERQYVEEYGTGYTKPRWYARLIGVVFKVVPKIGPFRPLAFKAPTEPTERLFHESLDKSRDEFRRFLTLSARGGWTLANKDLDTGYDTAIGEYRLADRAYEKLLEKLSAKKFAGVPRALARNVAAFYGSVEVLPGDTSRHHKRSVKVRQRLAKLAEAAIPAD